MEGKLLPPRHLSIGLRALVVLGLLSAGCHDCPTCPTTPESLPSSMEIRAVSPLSGGTVVLPEDYIFHVPGGVVIPPNSGHISVSLFMRSAPSVPWAQLNVYLLTGGQNSTYCGQNLPDSPTWGFLQAGWTTTYTVTGFQVYNLPCDVTGIRAMLHTRNNGLLTPPNTSETIAEATYPVSFQIRR
jgi:hypothetical protein